MKNLNNPYPSPPGAILRIELEEMTNEKYFQIPLPIRTLLCSVMAGKFRVDDEHRILVRWVGGTKELWVNLQQQYDEWMNLQGGADGT